MATDLSKSERRKRIWYWITTGLLAFGMFSGGFAQFIQAKFNTDGFIHLGYPLYSMKLIGAWKMAGVIVLLIPGFLLVKEWAYAGFFFLLTGAVTSHIGSGDQFFQWVAPFTFAVLTVLSWYLRPANRRIVHSQCDEPANQANRT
jgi:DoxX-like family